MQGYTTPKFEWPPFVGAMGFSVLLLVWVLSLSGCPKNPLTIYRPNARTPLEERSYNALLVSERLITEAEASNAAGTLPDFMRPIVNALIEVHNLGRTAAANYVAVIGAETEEEKAQALLDLLTDLDAEISKMFRGGGGP